MPGQRAITSGFYSKGEHQPCSLLCGAARHGAGSCSASCMGCWMSSLSLQALFIKTLVQHTSPFPQHLVSSCLLAAHVSCPPLLLDHRPSGIPVRKAGNSEFSKIIIALIKSNKKLCVFLARGRMLFAVSKPRG